MSDEKKNLELEPLKKLKCKLCGELSEEETSSSLNYICIKCCNNSEIIARAKKRLEEIHKNKEDTGSNEKDDNDWIKSLPSFEEAFLTMLVGFSELSESDGNIIEEKDNKKDLEK